MISSFWGGIDWFDYATLLGSWSWLSKTLIIRQRTHKSNKSMVLFSGLSCLSMVLFSGLVRLTKMFQLYSEFTTQLHLQCGIPETNHWHSCLWFLFGVLPYSVFLFPSPLPSVWKPSTSSDFTSLSLVTSTPVLHIPPCLSLCPLQQTTILENPCGPVVESEGWTWTKSLLVEWGKGVDSGYLREGSGCEERGLCQLCEWEGERCSPEHHRC